MSRWIAALIACASSGRQLSSDSVPSISGGKMKRRVRFGRAVSLAHQLRERAGDFELVAQPAALSLAPGRGWSRWQETISAAASWDRRRASSPSRPRGSGVLAGLDDAWSRIVSPAASRLEGPRGLERDHEREGRMGVEGADVAPAHEILVLARPGGLLVLGVAHDPAAPKRRPRAARPRPAASDQHDLAAHVASRSPSPRCRRRRRRARRRRPRSRCPGPSVSGRPPSSPDAGRSSVTVRRISQSSANSASHARRDRCVP